MADAVTCLGVQRRESRYVGSPGRGRERFAGRRVGKGQARRRSTLGGNAVLVEAAAERAHGRFKEYGILRRTMYAAYPTGPWTVHHLDKNVAKNARSPIRRSSDELMTLPFMDGSGGPGHPVGLGASVVL
jgi:hypothetical protein